MVLAVLRADKYPANVRHRDRLPAEFQLHGLPRLDTLNGNNPITLKQAATEPQHQLRRDRLSLFRGYLNG